jgi:lysyl-tRNA synthetase class 1
MNWLNKVVEEIIEKHPDGEIIISSGVSPSGTYHVGHLREVLTADALVLELKKRKRSVRHLHVVDDYDGLRKIPANVPDEFKEHLGKPLVDVPSPDGSHRTYADYFVEPFLDCLDALGVEIEIVHASEKYRAGFFAGAIEKLLANIGSTRDTLKNIAGRQLDPHWTPIQVLEAGRLKNRRFTKIDPIKKTVYYEDVDGNEQTADYSKGEVKMNWRVDWPARWWMLGVDAEPFGRDHATKGGSYDTGVGLMKNVFEAEPPVPVPYNFINLTGDTKKMSASKGTGVDISEVIKVLPSEVVRYFVLRYAPEKTLFFDSGMGAVRLVDEFAALAANENPTDSEKQLLYICTGGRLNKTVSRIPFSHLVASYQAALKDTGRTLEVIERTEHGETVKEDEEIIREELKFIDEWLNRWAPEEVKFSLQAEVDKAKFSEAEKDFLVKLADKVVKAPADADGEWFHKAIYDFKETSELSSKELFTTLYRALIDKTSGPRAGLFLSMLPRDWLVRRLKLED